MTKFNCSLSKLVMAEPYMIIETGMTYEREEIEKWLKNYNTCPLTRKTLTNKDLTCNRTFRSELEDYLKEKDINFYRKNVYLPDRYVAELHEAIINNNLRKLKEVLTWDPRLLDDMLVYGNDKISAYSLACREGSPEIVKFLIEKLKNKNLLDKYKIDKDNNEANNRGAQNIQLSRLLLTNLTFAEFEEYIALGANIRYRNYSQTAETALHHACGNGNLEIVKYLIDHAPELLKTKDTINSWMPIFCAVFHNRQNVVEYVWEYCENINNQITQLLHMAIEKQYNNLVEFLIDHGADVNTRFDKDNTCLHLAVNQSNLALAKLLLDKKADINILNKIGQSPLYLAAENGNVALVKLFIKSDKDVNYCNTCIAVHLAAKLGHYDVLKVLIESGADINLPDRKNYNRTPLHVAAENGHKEIVQFLINKHPKYKLKDSANPAQSPYEIIIKKYPDVALHIDELEAAMPSITMKTQEGLLKQEETTGLIQNQLNSANEKINKLERRIAIFEKIFIEMTADNKSQFDSYFDSDMNAKDKNSEKEEDKGIFNNRTSDNNYLESIQIVPLATEAEKSNKGEKVVLEHSVQERSENLSKSAESVVKASVPTQFYRKSYSGAVAHVPTRLIQNTAEEKPVNINNVKNKNRVVSFLERKTPVKSTEADTCQSEKRRYTK